MNNRGREDFNDVDKTGEVISWVIIFLFLFIFWPVGLVLLFRKLRGYTKSNRQPGNAKFTSGNMHAAAGMQPGIGMPSGFGAQSGANMQTNAGMQPGVGAQPNSGAQPGALGANAQLGPVSQAFMQNTRKNLKRHPLQKKTGRAISVLLLLLSMVMLIIGVAGAASTVGQIFGSASIDWYNIVMSSFFLGGGVFTFFSRNVVAHRYSRYKNYYAFIGGREVVPLSDLAQVAGKSINTVRRDLQTMINNGYLEHGAYIDNELECLVLSAQAAYKLRMDIMDSSGSEASASNDTQMNQYTVTLAELREVNSFIVDEEISRKVARLEELTAKIFKIAEESPEKKPQLKRFTNYYLPTTLKLVRSYVTLERQGVKGDNIMSTKKNIGDILDTLLTGFEQQLDQLFKSDAIDIASDINVLENLMQQDGLTGDKPDFQTASGGAF